MARSTTVADLVTRVRVEAGMIGDANPSDANVVAALDTEWTALYGIMASSKRGFFSASTTLVTDGTSTRPLPTDFRDLLRLDYDPGASQQLIPLEETPLQEIHRFARTGPRATHFLMQGATIEFFPTPPVAQNYALRYVPAPKKLTTSATPAADEQNSVDGISGWEDRLVLGAVKRLREAEESDTSSVSRAIDKADERVAAEAGDRNAMSAMRIAEVETYDPYCYDWRPRLPPR